MNTKLVFSLGIVFCVININHVFGQEEGYSEIYLPESSDQQNEQLIAISDQGHNNEGGRETRGLGGFGGYGGGAGGFGGGKFGGAAFGGGGFKYKQKIVIKKRGFGGGFGGGAFGGGFGGLGGGLGGGFLG